MCDYLNVKQVSGDRLKKSGYDSRKALRRLLKISLRRTFSSKNARYDRWRRICKREEWCLESIESNFLKRQMRDKEDVNAGKVVQSVAERFPIWKALPHELLIKIFQFLSQEHLIKVSQVCQMWNSVGQDPVLWRNVEINVGKGNDSTPQELIRFILKNHLQHLKTVIFKTDSSKQSAEEVCSILRKLVHCSLRTLAVISCTTPVFLDIDHELFTSALNVLFDRTDKIRSLAVDYTPIDDPSLKTLAKNHSKTLQLLKLKSCPKLSPEGVLSVTDNCHRLRELSINYTLLSDDILRSLSSDRHVRLTHLRIDVVLDQKAKRKNRISTRSWQALVDHSPNLNLILYFFVVDAEIYDSFFYSYNPVSHLYFCEYVPKSILQRISMNCPRVKELVVNGTDGPDIDAELISLGRHCQKLTSIGLSQCYVTCSAFIEFVRISCGRLSELFISEDCLIQNFDCDLQTVIVKVSQMLCIDWEPEFVPLW